MPSKSQLQGIFRTLPRALVKKEHADAKLFGKALDTIALAAYQYFLGLPVEERMNVYSSMPRKIMGRKVK
jgi:hypothetical protein